MTTYIAAVLEMEVATSRVQPLKCKGSLALVC